MNVPLLGAGHVRHTRLRPRRHAFAYAVPFLLLPMRSWGREPQAAALPRNRFAPISFHDTDHGEGGPDALAWLEGLLAQHGVTGCDGEIWLQCLPRIFGFAFKPVSFWFCHAAHGQLRAVVAEVNNTFGRRHCYVLSPAAWGHELQAGKTLHVSPFCTVEGHYRFRFLRSDASNRMVARIDYHDDAGLLLQTSISGTLQTARSALLWRTALAQPWQGLSILWRIHWQALRLWLRRVPFNRDPAVPARQ